MGCNCGKSTRPLGAKTSATTTSVTTVATAKFVLETPDRRTQTFGSKLEADAARVRQGGVVRFG